MDRSNWIDDWKEARIDKWIETTINEWIEA